MNDVVSIEAVRSAREDAAFERYRLAVLKVQATLDSQDGLEAGRAWRAYLDTFMSPDQRERFAQLDRAMYGGTRQRAAPRSGPAA